jgi:transposase-like protein
MAMVLNQLTLNNIIIESRENDHFINATQLCKANNKLFGNWIDQKSSKELIKALEDTLKNELEISTQMNNNLKNSNIGIPILDRSTQIHNNSKLTKVKVIDVKVGGNHSGSWIHPDLAIPLAQWVSPPFSIQVTKWIRELLITGSVSIESQKTNQQLIELTKKLAIKDKELEDARLGNLKLTNKVLNVRPFENNGWVYICTNNEWACKNVFRIGKTTNIDNRMKNYRSASLSDEKMKYVFLYETNHMDALETLLRNVLIKFREDTKADQYILHWNILEPFVKNICNIFTNQIMTASNNLIQENEEISEESYIPIGIDPKDVNIDNIDKIQKNSKLSYYEQIMYIVNIYKDEGAELLTPKEEISRIYDNVVLKCNHKEWAVQVGSLTRKQSWGCHACALILKEKDYGDDYESDNYKLLMSTVNKYADARVLTKKKFIRVITDKITLKCPHKTWDTNVEAVAVLEHWKCGSCKNLLNEDSDETDIPLYIGGHLANQYYKLLLEQALKYPNSQILTPKEKITKGLDRVEIQCPHKTFESSVVSVARNGRWNCRYCKPTVRKKNK